MSVLTPWEMAYAERKVLKEYGVSVSIMDTLRSLNKFGLNPAIGTSFETVWQSGDDETYVTTNAIDSISSSSAADTQTVTIDGFTVSGTGTSQKFMRVQQTATLDGQTRVALTTPVARVERQQLPAGATALAGTTYIYENTAIVAGVPSDLTKVHLTVTPTYQQSQKAAFTIANGEFFFLTDIGGGVTQKTNAAGLMAFQTRPPGGAFRTRFNIPVAQGFANHNFRMGTFIIPRNHDVRFRAISSTNNTEFVAHMSGYYAEVRSSL